MKMIGLWIFLMFLAVAAVAQKDDARYSETQIAKESKFVDAAQLQLLGKFEEALVLYEKILKDESEDAEQNDVIYFQMSRCFEALKDYKKSIKYVKMAFEHNSSNEFYLRQLAEAYEGNNEVEKAGDLFFNFTDEVPQEPFFYEKAVYAFVQVRAYDKAVRVLDKMEKKLGVSEDVTRQKFEIFSKRGESKKAIKELKKLIKAYPKEVRFTLNLANYYLRLDEISKAKSAYKDVLTIEPTNETALRFMELSSNPASNELKYIRASSADVGNPEIPIDTKLAKLLPAVESYVRQPTREIGIELESIVEMLVRTHPTEAKSHALRGDVMLHSGKLEEAVSSYKTTLEIDGSVFDVWYQLMVAQRRLELYDELRKTSDQALLRFPNQGIAYLFHGHALNQLNQTKEAFNVLQEAMMFVGKDNQLRGDLKVEMAYSRYMQGSYDLAIKILDSELPENAAAYELKGDILFKQADIEGAVIEWKKAAKLEPKNTKLLEKSSRKQL